MAPVIHELMARKGGLRFRSSSKRRALERRGQSIRDCLRHAPTTGSGADGCGNRNGECVVHRLSVLP